MHAEAWLNLFNLGLTLLSIAKLTLILSNLAKIGKTGFNPGFDPG